MRPVTAAVARLQREPAFVETALLKRGEHRRCRRVATDTASEVHHALYSLTVVQPLKFLQQIVVIHMCAPVIPSPGACAVPVPLLYTGMVRCVWARPIRAVSSRCPAMTRTPSSILRA